MDLTCDENGFRWTTDVKLAFTVIIASHFAPQVISDEEWEDIAASMREELKGLTDTIPSAEEMRDQWVNKLSGGYLIKNAQGELEFMDATSEEDEGFVEDEGVMADETEVEEGQSA